MPSAIRQPTTPAPSTPVASPAAAPSLPPPIPQYPLPSGGQSTAGKQQTPELEMVGRAAAQDTAKDMVLVEVSVEDTGIGPYCALCIDAVGSTHVRVCVFLHFCAGIPEPVMPTLFQSWSQGKLSVTNRCATAQHCALHVHSASHSVPCALCSARSGRWHANTAGRASACQSSNGLFT
jgi:hypothetical protein